MQDIADPAWVASRELDIAFDALIERDLTFDALVRPPHLSPLLERLERHPGLKVVIDHGAKPHIAGGAIEPWRSGLAAIAKQTSAYCKLSGFLTEASPEWRTDGIKPYTDEIFKLFGPARIMWGSDWPVVNLVSDYAAWMRVAKALCADFSNRERARIFGETAAEFYGLATTRMAS